MQNAVQHVFGDITTKASDQLILSKSVELVKDAAISAIDSIPAIKVQPTDSQVMAVSYKLVKDVISRAVKMAKEFKRGTRGKSHRREHRRRSRKKLSSQRNLSEGVTTYEEVRFHSEVVQYIWTLGKFRILSLLR